MEVEATDAEFAQWINEAFRGEIHETDEAYIYDLHRIGASRPLALSRDLLAGALGNLREMDAVEETVISNAKSYEFLIREESNIPRLRFRLRDEDFLVDDQDNGIRYRIASPSNEYLLFLLYKVSAIASPRALMGAVPVRRMVERPGYEEIQDVFDLLRRALPRFMTLRLESERNRNFTDLGRFANAFIFQLSYNTDIALVPQRHVEELVRTGRIARIRRASLSDIDPPRRHYLPDLIYHYQLAVGADNPFLEYISYYHVAEHFFEEVFSEDLVLRIKDKLTQPDFSYKRKKDVGMLIRDISRSLQVRNERITFSEQEALRLTIDRYVDIADLREKIREYDSSLLNYYRSSTVGFSGGDEVDLENSDVPVVTKRLAVRHERRFLVG
jgi:hypothetical protein